MFRNETHPTKVKELYTIINKRSAQIVARLNKHLIAKYLKCNVRYNSKEIESFKPFHWALEFNSIIDQGFDIAIGNPPYVEKSSLSYKLIPFITDDCGSIYAYFVENALRLLRDGGRLGIMVSMSAFCTQRMITLTGLLEEQCSEIRISNFGWRPSRLFDKVNRAISILLAIKRKVERTKIYTTKYIKWYTEPKDERPDLFKTIRYHDLSKGHASFIIPKIESSLEESILEKLYHHSGLMKDFILPGKTEYVIFYKSTGGLYWKIITDFKPKFYEKGVSGSSSREKHLYFKNNEQRLLALALYNSNLFWWFYTINSNCRDLNPYDLRSFPVDLDKIDGHLKADLKDLVRQLMIDLQKNSKFVKRSHKQKEPVRIQQISPRKSKGIIDEIDRKLAEIYHLTVDELQFIIHFDERFRMQDNPDEEE